MNKSSGFLQTEGKKIVDAEGNPIILRGMGFGGWLLQEPYMMKVGEICAGGQQDIFHAIKSLIGKEKLEIYRKAWLDNYCTEDDIAELKKAGFNSLRLPLHYNLFTLPAWEEPVYGRDTWLEEGFKLVDTLLEWCKTYGIYLILDLHAAPGGQGHDRHINDYDPAKPSLWEEDEQGNYENKRKTIALWSVLAKRYANEKWIGGYDLLNETCWSFNKNHQTGKSGDELRTAKHGGDDGPEDNAPLKELNSGMIAAIRAVDPNHIIFIEGNYWAGNHRGLWPVDDDNTALSFHRYWIKNSVETLRPYLELRDKYNIPLWMGESGENDNEWYAGAVKLLEDNDIGWAWWTWKKMDSDSGSFSIKQTEGYEGLWEYFKKGGEKPPAETAFKVMMQTAENAKLENCIRNDGAIKALFTPSR